MDSKRSNTSEVGCLHGHEAPDASHRFHVDSQRTHRTPRSEENNAMPQSEVVTVYAGEQPPPHWSAAVFLAGPTPREAGVRSWRPDAISELRGQWDRDGRLVVFAPEPRDGRWVSDYIAQVSWEYATLNLADEILFWVPREVNHLPGLTTNVEYGAWCDSGKVVFGAPVKAPKNRYLHHYADQNHIPTAASLPETVRLALVRIGDGALRRDGERHVPLLVWRTSSFQRWYQTLHQAGNRLLGARLEWTFRVGPTRGVVFYWALHARVHVQAEDRVKDNEVVICRPDLSTVVLYHPAARWDDTVVVLVREFRASARTPSGYICELPGGAADSGGPREQAAVELAEETGLAIDARRLASHGSRQVAGTVSGHHAHLFSAEITSAELDRLRQLAHTAHGNPEDTERTWLAFRTLGELRNGDEVDWATLGMVTQVLLGWELVDRADGPADR